MFFFCFVFKFHCPNLGVRVLYTNNYSSRVLANAPGNQGSIPSQVITKTQKMVLDTSLLNTQHYKACTKGKVEQSRERSSALPYTFV